MLEMFWTIHLGITLDWSKLLQSGPLVLTVGRQNSAFCDFYEQSWELCSYILCVSGRNNKRRAGR